jgi:hypothetical protein
LHHQQQKRNELINQSINKYLSLGKTRISNCYLDTMVSPKGID